jgi:hypothetical protein
MSDRDKKLLIIVLIAAILGGSYWGFNKLTEQNDLYEVEVRELSQRHSDLVSKNASKAKFEKDTLINTAAFNKVFSDYNTWLSQDRTLLFLSAVEKNTGVWLKQLSLDATSEVYKFGTVQSSNPSNSGGVVYNTDNAGIVTTTNVSYECSYEELKKVLAYMNEHGKKATITSMSFAYEQGADIVSGTMAISFYAITGSDRPVQDVDIKDVFVGTDNIFSSDTFVPNGTEASYKDIIVADYDLYLIVNRTGADKDAVICGQSGDPNNTATISTNGTGLENVVIKVTGRGGDYKVSYQVGSKQYPAESFDQGAPLICGDSIELLIMSNPIGADNDTTGVNLFIINETDIAVNAAIINDDTTTPRVKVNSTEGAVVFH